MEREKEAFIKTFGNRLRIRVNGIYVESDQVLMIRHRAVGEKGEFWSPPGGGMEFGSSATENLEREFIEETGLRVKVERLLFVHEYLNVPLHAVELFFFVSKIDGEIIKGTDPEMDAQNQIISEVKFMSMKEIKSLDRSNRHQAFDLCDNIDDLLQLRGYYRL